MKPERGEDLTARTFRFTCDVYDFCEELVRNPGLQRRVGYQLFNAGSSVGANREEAKAAYSRREFSSKNALSLKECREANFWLRVAEKKSLGNVRRRTLLIAESNALISIFTTIVKHLQSPDE
jgi:four helix bundle protein